jgi:hypothetical protein
MTEFIRKNLKTFYSLCAALILFSFSSAGVYAAIVVEGESAEGAWQVGELRSRSVLYTDMQNQKASIVIDVPSAGRYTLFGYLFHAWQKDFATLFVEACDEEGNLYRGYHALENIWYTYQATNGRWFWASLSDNPYWDLPKGTLKVTFWASGKETAWTEKTKELESLLAIDTFILAPAFCEGIPWGPSIEETEDSDWDIFTYVPEYSTNIISSGKEGSSHGTTFSFVESGEYTAFIDVFACEGGFLELSLVRNGKTITDILPIIPSPLWQRIETSRMKVNAGRYEVRLCDRTSYPQHRLMVDSLFLFRKSSGKSIKESLLEKLRFLKVLHISTPE